MSLELTNFQREMRNKINNKFSEEELQILCFDLGVDYEEIPGQTKQLKSGQLILYLARRARLEDLLQEVIKQRPPIEEWPADAPTISQQAEQSLQFAKNRDPLLRAAFDLQSRFYNIVKGNFLKAYYHAFQEYAVFSTLFVIAQYFSYVEIMRWEDQILDFGDTSEEQDPLSKIEKLFATDKINHTFMIFRAEQRAIGEIMIIQKETANGPKLSCIGYAEFINRMGDPTFSRWFSRLSADIERLATGNKRHSNRLILLQNALIDLIDVLDPEKKRISKDRSKIPVQI